MNTTNTLVSVDPSSPRFLRLITNPEAEPLGHRRVDTTPAIQRVRDYARFVLDGANGKPFCPFVAQTERENGYSIGVYPNAPHELDLQGVLAEIEGEFHRLSPGVTLPGQPLDTTIVMAAFSHPDAEKPEFCAELAAIYEANRTRILSQGMLIGYMSPSHPPDEAGQSLFKSDISLLSVDRLHPSHRTFMRDDRERAIHRSFFPTDATARRCPFSQTKE